MSTMQALTRFFSLPAPEFTFAGFTFPRWVATLDKRPRARKLEARRNPMAGPYYHAPRPLDCQRPQDGRSFYLDDFGAPGLRWAWCDDIPEDWICDVVPDIRHAGWFLDDDGAIAGTIRGVVFKIPKGRGYLAGWSMGESMASFVDASTAYCVVSDAAYAADGLAKGAAEREREYREQQREILEAEEGATI